MLGARTLLIAPIVLMLTFSAAVADDDLGVLLEQALHKNAAVQASIEGIKSAYENIAVAGATLEWSSSLRASSSVEERRIDSAPNIYQEDNDLTLTLTKPLYDGGQAKAQTRIAQIQLNQAIMGYRAAEQDLLNQALTALVNRTTAAQSLVVSQANVERLGAQVKASQLRLDIGDGTPTQLALATSRLARAEAALISTETRLATAEANLRRYFDTPLPSLTTLPTPLASDEVPPSAGATADKALTHNPDYLHQSFNTRIARYNMDRLLASLRPQLELELSGRTADSNIDSSRQDALSASITLRTPLYATPASRARSRGLVAEHQAALQQLVNSQDALRISAETAWRDYRTAASLITASAAEAHAATLFRDGVEVEVEFGLKSLLDLLDAEQDMVAAELRLIEARGNYLLAGYGLLKAIGGLNAARFGIAPAFTDLETLPAHDLPFKGIIPRVTYSE